MDRTVKRWEEGHTVNHRYRVVRRIGGGGCGDVYAVDDLELKRQRAMKVLKLRDDGRQRPAKALLESLRTEAQRRGAAGNHPSIVEIFDVQALPSGEPFMVMELLEGIDLGRRSKVPFEEAMEIMVVATDAISAAHRNGVVHLDLKPSNIFVTTFGQTKVVDFGMATAIGASIMGGTPDFMPPEQFHSLAGAHTTADVYSLAATLYALLIGAPPGPPTPTSPVKLSPELPPALRPVLQRALSYSPEARHPNAGELLADLISAAPGLAGLRALQLSPDRVPLDPPTIQAKEALALALKEGRAGLEDTRRTSRNVRAQFAESMIEVCRALRSLKAFPELLAEYDDLPPSTQREPELRELRTFALNRLGRHAEAEAVIRELIEEEVTSERAGLLGRIMKDQYAASLQAGQLVMAAEFLKRAIGIYRTGFRLDPADPYCGINALTLMELLDGGSGDEALLAEVFASVKARVAGPAPSYWDLASLLELEVLADNPRPAREAMVRVLAAARTADLWAPLTTARNLGLLQRARSAAGRDGAWLGPIIDELIAVRGT